MNLILVNFEKLKKNIFIHLKKTQVDSGHFKVTQNIFGHLRQFFETKSGNPGA